MNNENEYFKEDEALERVDGDTELLFELVDLFFEDYASTCNQMADAIASGDGEGLEQRAHSIKSALGNLGAMHAFHIAFALENMGREGNVEGAAEVLAELKESVRLFQEAVDQLRQ